MSHPETSDAKSATESKFHEIPQELLVQIFCLLRSFVKTNSRELINLLVKNRLNTCKVAHLFSMTYTSKIRGFYVPTPSILRPFDDGERGWPYRWIHYSYYERNFKSLTQPGPAFLYLLEHGLYDLDSWGAEINRLTDETYVAATAAGKAKSLVFNTLSYYLAADLYYDTKYRNLKYKLDSTIENSF